MRPLPPILSPATCPPSTRTPAARLCRLPFCPRLSPARLAPHCPPATCRPPASRLPTCRLPPPTATTNPAACRPVTYLPAACRLPHLLATICPSTACHPLPAWPLLRRSWPPPRPCCPTRRLPAPQSFGPNTILLTTRRPRGGPLPRQPLVPPPMRLPSSAAARRVSAASSAHVSPHSGSHSWRNVVEMAAIGWPVWSSTAAATDANPVVT